MTRQPYPVVFILADEQLSLYAAHKRYDINLIALDAVQDHIDINDIFVYYLCDLLDTLIIFACAFSKCHLRLYIPIWVYGMVFCVDTEKTSRVLAFVFIWGKMNDYSGLCLFLLLEF